LTAGPAAPIAPAFVALDRDDIPANVAAVLAKLDDLPAATTALVIGHTVGDAAADGSRGPGAPG
jgi:hypothetical protein